MLETTTSDAVARLEALTARLDRLEAENAALKAENARLRSAESSDVHSVVEEVAGSARPSTTRPQGDRRASGAGVLKRRGLLAGVAAVVGAGLAKLGATERAYAGHGPSDAVSALHLGAVTNFTPTDPELRAIGNGNISSASGPATLVFTSRLNALAGRFGLLGIIGDGIVNVPFSEVAALWGVSTGMGAGVLGQSTNAVGVQGVSTNSAGIFGQGPIGLFATGTGVAGVFGGSTGNGFGFWGNSVTSAGVYGTSTSGPGVRAESTNSFGLHAKSPTWAGVFEGNVFVTGREVALGGVGASAATTTTRTLAEDVGEATLVNGKATVALSKEFAEEVKDGRYQVFVTPHDASGRGLAVVARRRDGFDVQELAGGAPDAGTTPGRGGNAGFSYRVVARLAGPTGPRQAPPALPDLTTIKPAPPLPEPPKVPELSVPSEPSGASNVRRRP